jgi:hypothetical protein
MPRRPSRQVALGPLLGQNGTRVADRTINGTFMRGGYNVGLRDGEWWVRKGQKLLDSRIGGVPWWWVMDINADLSIVANAFYALAYNVPGAKVEPLYTPDVTESVSFTNNSATATSTTMRTVGQLILVPTDEVYRVTGVAGTTVTLNRVYTDTTASETCRFIDPLNRDTTGTHTGINTATPRLGSCVVFEQLVTNSSAAVHAASPATTAGHSYLVITSDRGVPVAVDLTAYQNGSPVDPVRLFFYNTSIGTPAQIGADYAFTSLNPRGVFAEVYRGRLFISYATDPSGLYGDRTIWYSQRGDLLRWHTGIQGQTAAPNFITFEGEGNEIAEMKNLSDDLVVHRWYSRELLTATGSASGPFSRRTHSVRIGIHDQFAMTSRVVTANGVHYIWTRNGPAVFDGSNVTLIAQRVYRDLLATEAIDEQGGVVCALHDERNRYVVWVLGTNSSTRHQDALPASSSDHATVLIYEYDTDEAWLEDHPKIKGGGTCTQIDGGSNVPQLLVSRGDGSILMMHGRTTAKDADFTDPDNGAAVTVNAQVETPWMDFGTLQTKQLLQVELVMRSISSSNHTWDKNTDLSSGNYWINMKVYGDFDEGTALATIGRVYDSTDGQLTQRGENRQATLFVVTLTPRVSGRQFKLVFSNALTSAASAAGYIQVPFRISDIICTVVDRDGDSPLTELGGASISE